MDTNDGHEDVGSMDGDAVEAVEITEEAKEETIADIINLIKDNYVQNPGLSFNTKSPFPIDLHSLSPEEIVNVYDNMKIQLNMRKRDDLIGRLVRILINSSTIATQYLGFKIPDSWLRTVNEDTILRESLAATMMGKGMKPHPIATLTLAFSDHVMSAVAAAIPIDESTTRETLIQAKATSTEDS